MGNSSLLNLISNYGSRLWSLVSVFIFIPIYIHYLGIESYAIIGFYSLLLGIISFADSGLSSAVLKEFASEALPSYKYSLLIKIEKIYTIVCGGIIIAIFFMSKIIAVNWLTSEKILADDLQYYIELIGIGVSLQLISSLYYGGLFGLNYQFKANLIQIIWTIFKSGFVILLLIVIKPTLEVFFIWQIVCNICYILILRFNLMKLLKSKNGKLKILFKKIPKETLNYIRGMTLIAIMSSINTQSDKIITSSFFSLKIFGYYTIASTLAQIPLLVTSPLVLSIFPIISKFSSVSESDKIDCCIKKTSFLINIIVFPLVIILYLYTYEIIKLWTKNSIEENYLNELILVVKCLTLGSLFMASQQLPFFLLLSKGKTKYSIIQGIIQLFIGIPLLYIFVTKYGLIGAGLPWIFINFCSLIFLYVVVFKRYINLDFLFFFKINFMIPLLISLIVCYCFYTICIPSFFYFFIFLSIVTSIFLNIVVFNFIHKVNMFNLKNVFDFING